MNEDPIRYYAERAGEYERIYEKPERQPDILKLKSILRDTFRGKSVFEIACGTGYWTQVISETAENIRATDINKSVLDIAKSKKYRSIVYFEMADIYQLPVSGQPFENGFGGFIWSHIPRQRIFEFLSGFTSGFSSRGSIVFLDNQYVAGSSTPTGPADQYGNTYQARKLSDGTLHKVVKNFPDDREIRKEIEPFGKNIEIIRLQYFWLVRFRIK